MNTRSSEAADRPSVTDTNPWADLADELDQSQDHRPRRRRSRPPRGATERGELPTRVARAFEAAKGGAYAKAPPGTVAELLTRYQSRCPGWAHRLYRNAGRKIPGPCRDQECSHCGTEAALDILRRIYGWLGAEAALVEATSSEARIAELRRGGPVWVLRRRDMGRDMWTVIRAGDGGLLNASRDRAIAQAVFLMPVQRDAPCACPDCAERQAVPSVVVQAPDVTDDEVAFAFEAEGIEVERGNSGRWRWNPSEVSEAAWCRIVWAANPELAQLRSVPYPARDPTPALT